MFSMWLQQIGLDALCIHSGATDLERVTLEQTYPRVDELRPRCARKLETELGRAQPHIERSP
jgi:hypothetical protein